MSKIKNLLRQYKDKLIKIGDEVIEYEAEKEGKKLEQRRLREASKSAPRGAGAGPAGEAKPIYTLVEPGPVRDHVDMPDESKFKTVLPKIDRRRESASVATVKGESEQRDDGRRRKRKPWHPNKEQVAVRDGLERVEIQGMKSSGSEGGNVAKYSSEDHRNKQTSTRGEASGSKPEGQGTQNNDEDWKSSSDKKFNDDVPRKKENSISQGLENYWEKRIEGKKKHLEAGGTGESVARTQNPRKMPTLRHSTSTLLHRGLGDMRRSIIFGMSSELSLADEQTPGENSKETARR